MAKKIISLILALTLTVFVGVFALAEEEEKQPEQETKEIAFEITGGQVVCGKTAEILLKVKKNAPFTQFTLTVDYDKEKLQFDSFEKQDAGFNGVTVSNDGGLSVSYFNSEPNTSEGTVCMLKFNPTEKTAAGDKIKFSGVAGKSVVLNGEEHIKFSVSGGEAWYICENHEFGEDLITDATCEENGKIVKTCQKCGYQDITVINSNGHKVENWNDISLSTCSEKGQKEGICTVCNKKITEELPLLDHEFGEWETMVNPTINNYGEQQRICAVCGFVDTQVLGKLVNQVADLYTGVEIMGMGNVSFYAETVLIANETRYSEMDDETQKSSDEFLSALEGKQIYSMFDIKFTYNEQPVEFEGNVTVLLPVPSALEGLVVAAEGKDGKLVVYNAAYKDGCVIFTAPEVLEKYYILFKSEDKDVLRVIKDIFSNDDDPASPEKSMAGWLKLLIIAVILLLVSAGLIFFKVFADRKKAAAEETADTEFTAEEITDEEQENTEIPEEYFNKTETPDAAPENFEVVGSNKPIYDENLSHDEIIADFFNEIENNKGENL